MFTKIKQTSMFSLMIIGLYTMYSTPLLAASEATLSESGHSDGTVMHFGITFFMFAIVLMAGKIGNVVERFGQPAVIGELLAGIALSALGYFGWGFIDEIAASQVIAWAASFGALLLLFSIGLESNLKEMSKVGTSALRVALVGVVLPFVVGTFVLGEIFFGDESQIARLFLGAALVATSVGIPSSVLRGLKLTKTKAAQTFLGATVVDDILGLIILAIVSAMATGGDASAGLVATLAAKSFGFLIGAIVLGTFLAKPISKMFSSLHTGVGMKLSIAVGFALVLGYLAEVFGLEPIIGAFAAGLLLDAVHFESYGDPEVVEDLKAIEFENKDDRQKVLGVIKKQRHSHIEDLINSIGLVFVPIFFVSIGLQVDFGSLLNPKLYLVGGIIAIVAFFTKFLAGFAADAPMPVRAFIGACMVPRGEVGLIFAATGKSLGALSDEMFSTILLAVVITTFMAPPLIKRFGMHMQREENTSSKTKKTKLPKTPHGPKLQEQKV
jgi:Kef-type K+ transport system membrane component KefB